MEQPYFVLQQIRQNNTPAKTGVFIYAHVRLVHKHYLTTEVEGQCPIPLHYRLVYQGQSQPVIILCEQIFALTENRHESVNGEQPLFP